MRFASVKCSFLAACLAMHTAGQAMPLNVVTVDGFVPLHNTVGMSIIDFLQGVGEWRSAYHLASSSEIAGLLQAFGLAPHAESADNLKELSYIRKIGGTGNGPDGTYFSDGFQGAIGMSLDETVSVGLTNGENTQPFPNCPSFRECSTVRVDYRAPDLNYRNNSIGLFLVEGATVPEPGSIAMFGLAGLMLGLGRRRTRS